MAIEKFTIGQFEEALPKHNQTGKKLWNFLGMQDGERVYVVPAGEFSRVVVRSSIDSTGYAADVGQDSIRIWLEIKNGGGWKAIKKLDTWTARTKGWDTRMIDKIRELYGMGRNVRRGADSCKCGNEKLIVWFVKKEGPNFNRPMSKCPMCGELVFLDKEAPVEDKPDEVDSDEMDFSSLLSELSTQNKDVLDQVGDVIEEMKEAKSPDPQQELAIFSATDRPIRVLAGAGSGKTFVIERRYQHLLNMDVKPEEIVVVTFSKAQSQDMAERIMMLNPSIRGTDGEKQICTIHAFCLRTLHKHKLGRRIPDVPWKIKQWLQDESKKLWPIVDENNKEKGRPSWDEIMSAIHNAKSRLIEPGMDWELYNEWWGGYQADRLTKIRERFDSWLREEGYWTFIDMLYDMEWHLVNNEQFREDVQRSFKYVMVDEAQDTNRQAMRILEMVAQPDNQVFVVGDPDQLLYRFTGATPEVNCYDGFDDRYPDGLSFFLETNYRSTKNIVGRGHSLIHHNYWEKGGPYNDSFFKNIRARHDAEEGVDVSFTMYPNQAVEAIAVAETITELLQDHNPNDIFVSSRTRAQLGVLEPVLTQMGIPFINITGGSFWMLGHVQKLLAWPSLLYNPTDSDSFGRIVNIATKNFVDRGGDYSPSRFLGRAFVDYCDGIYDRETVLRSPNHRRAWYYGANDFVDLMDELERVNKDGGHVAVLEAALEHYRKYIWYEEGKNGDEEEIGKIDDLKTVIDIAKRFDTWDEFMERVQKAIQAAEDAKNKNWDRYVVLSTVHRLKGMERPVMFGIGWCENPEKGMGLLPHTFSLGTTPPSGVLDFSNGSKVEDERCIAYVCVTRAKERVFLSGVENFRETEMFPSRFAMELMRTNG